MDVRPRFLSITGQEVLSSDSVSVRVSLAAEFQIVDPAKAITSVEDYHDALYVTAQLALREIVGGSEIDELLELMHLRLLQEIGSASGHTIVLGLPGVTTVPIRAGGEPHDAPEIEAPDDL